MKLQKVDRAFNLATISSKSKSDYEFKRIIQSLVYLAQLRGVDFGYKDFSIQVCGVYSPELSRDLNKVIK